MSPAIIIPHPVLRPENADYREGQTFDMSTKVTEKLNYTLDGKISVPVEFVLESKFIRKLIHDEKARLVVIVKCTHTHERAIFNIDSTENTTLKLPHEHYIDKIILSPYVSATVPIKPFKSDEHHEEFTDVDIGIPAGAILAQGSDTILTIDALHTLSAAIRLVPNAKLENGEFRIELEEDYIDIYVNDETRRSVEALRKTNLGILYPSMYMAALTHAIQNITPDRTRKWEETLRKTLEKNEINVNDEDELARKGYEYAQKLLKYPIKYITTESVAHGVHSHNTSNNRQEGEENGAE